MAKEYKISDRAKLFLSLGDLTAWTGDAIVNAGEGRAHACLKLASDMHRPVPANERMLGGGGVDGGEVGPNTCTCALRDVDRR